MLRAADPEDLPRIENLMQFYNYDLSEWCLASFGHSGLYAIRPKEAYWQRPKVRPYIAEAGTELAGFAVVDDEVLEAGTQYNLGYFFLGRRFRGEGNAQKMAEQLFALHPGRWEIYSIASNLPAMRFWDKAIVRAGCRSVLTREIVADGEACRLFSFATPPVRMTQPTPSLYDLGCMRTSLGDNK